MTRRVPLGLGDTNKDRWARAQSHEAGFWQRKGILGYQRERVASRYEGVVKSLAKSGAHARVLEVGSGPTCAARVFPNAQKVYLDPLMRVYRPLIPAEVVGAFVCATGEQLPFVDGQFDVTFSFNVIDHVQSPSQFVAELIRVTKPAGKVVLGVYTHPRVFAAIRAAIERVLPVFGEVAHPYFFSRESLVRLLESRGLQVEELHRVYAPSKRPALRRQDWVAIASRVAAPEPSPGSTSPH